jgi:hypothetical protein
MRTRTTVASALCAIAILAGAHRAATQPASPTPPADPSASDTTQVEGEIPTSMKGRWLLAAEAGPSIPGAQAGSAAGSGVILRTFEILDVDGQAKVVLHRGALSPELKRRIDPRAVSPQKGVPATPGEPGPGAAPPSSRRPDPAIMAEVVRAWPTLPAGDPRTVASQLQSEDKVSEADKERYGAPDTRVLVTMDETYLGGGAKPNKSITVLAVQEIAPDRMAGKYLQAVLLGGQQSGQLAFPPVPLALEGRFAAYRVGDEVAAAEPSAPATPGSPAAQAPARSKGFLDVFSGCGGR